MGVEHFPQNMYRYVPTQLSTSWIVLKPSTKILIVNLWLHSNDEESVQSVGTIVENWRETRLAQQGALTLLNIQKKSYDDRDHRGQKKNLGYFTKRTHSLSLPLAFMQNMPNTENFHYKQPVHNSAWGNVLFFARFSKWKHCTEWPTILCKYVLHTA